MKSEVFNTDCLEYMRTLPDKAFDLAIADPPYGDAKTVGDTPPPHCKSTHYTFGLRKRDSNYQNRRNMGNEIRKKIVAWDVAPSKEFFTELFRVSRNQIIWGGNYFEMPPCRCFVVWRKLSISEEFSMAMAEYAWTSFNTNAKVFECAPQGKASDPRFHPTQKPTELYAWLLKNYAKEGDRIFDPMMGSQSSRIAAYKMVFDYVGCELDKEYFDKGCERFDRECHNIRITTNGTKVQQLTLF